MVAASTLNVGGNMETLTKYPAAEGAMVAAEPRLESAIRAIERNLRASNKRAHEVFQRNNQELLRRFSVARPTRPEVGSRIFIPEVKFKAASPVLPRELRIPPLVTFTPPFLQGLPVTPKIVTSPDYGVVEVERADSSIGHIDLLANVAAHDPTALQYGQCFSRQPSAWFYVGEYPVPTDATFKKLRIAASTSVRGAVSSLWWFTPPESYSAFTLQVILGAHIAGRNMWAEDRIWPAIDYFGPNVGWGNKSYDQRNELSLIIDVSPGDKVWLSVGALLLAGVTDLYNCLFCVDFADYQSEWLAPGWVQVDAVHVAPFPTLTEVGG
jgi:hypothetical protein